MSSLDSQALQWMSLEEVLSFPLVMFSVSLLIKIKLVNLPCLLSSCHVIDALLRVWLLSSRIVGWGNDFYLKINSSWAFIRTIKFWP